MGRLGKPLISALVIYLIALPLLVSAAAEEENDLSCSAFVNTATDLKYKIIAIFSTLIVGVFGVCLPIFGLDLEGPFFFLVRALAACVIIVIGDFQILPDATESLTSSFIGDEPPWGIDFPMTRVVATAAAILTMVELFALASMDRSHSETSESIAAGDKEEENHNGHVHNNASQGFVPVSQHKQNLVTRVVELGFVIHSVIIGISLGATSSVITIKPFIAAITLHQLCRGIYLGGCFSSKAMFELKKTLVMVILYSLTTPVGIGIGIGLAETYKENSLTTLMVSGFLNAAAAGILNYMAFFISYHHKAQRSLKLLIPSGHMFCSVLVRCFY